MGKSEFRITTPHLKDVSSIALTEVIVSDNIIMIIKNSCNGNSEDFIMRVKECAAKKGHYVAKITDLAEVLSISNRFASAH